MTLWCNVCKQWWWAGSFTFPSWVSLDNLSLSLSLPARNIWCVPLPRYQGLSALWPFSKVWYLRECLGMGLSVGHVNENSTLWRPCFCASATQGVEDQYSPMADLSASTSSGWLVAELHGEYLVILHIASLTSVSCSSSSAPPICNPNSEQSFIFQ